MNEIKFTPVPMLTAIPDGTIHTRAMTRDEIRRTFPPQYEWSDGLKAAFAEMQNRPPGELS